jgi:tetratricopeptide (TPR) repeat protein
MGLLDWISKQSFSRPFHKNQTRADLKEWFAKAPGWDTLDPKIAEALIERLYGNPRFEVFVHLSREGRLISQYAELNELLGKGADEAFVGAINNILFRTGLASLEVVVKLIRPSGNQDELKKHYGFATDCFECAIELQPSFLHAYVQLAILKHLFNRDDEARDLCNRGLVQAEILKKPVLPSRSGMNLRGTVDEAEVRLRNLLTDLGEGETVPAGSQQAYYLSIEEWLKSVGHYEKILELQGTDNQFCTESLMLYKAGWEARESEKVVGGFVAEFAHKYRQNPEYGLIFIQVLREGLSKKARSTGQGG